MSTAEVNGATIAYEISGSGPPVVLVPQAGADRRAWRAQIPALEREFTVVRLDQRGHGESTWGRGGAFSYLDDLRSLLDHLELERAALVGGSLGGRVCLELAATEPDRVTHLALLAIGLPDWDWSAAVREFGAQEEAAEDAGDLERAIDLGLRFWVDGSRRPKGAAPADVRELVREMNRRCYAIPTPDPAPEPGALDPPVGTRLADVRAGTLVVVGDADTEDMQRVADVLADRIPRARKVVLPDTAHMVQLERPGEVTRLLVEFLRDGRQVPVPILER